MDHWHYCLDGDYSQDLYFSRGDISGVFLPNKQPPMRIIEKGALFLCSLQNLCSHNLRLVYTSDLCLNMSGYTVLHGSVELNYVCVYTSDMSRRCDLNLDSHHCLFLTLMKGQHWCLCCSVAIRHCFKIAVECRSYWDQPQFHRHTFSHKLATLISLAMLHDRFDTAGHRVGHTIGQFIARVNRTMLFSN